MMDKERDQIGEMGDTVGVAGSVDINAEHVNSRLIEEALKGEFRAASFRSIVGYVLLLGGLVLVFLGFTGTIEFELEVLGFNSTLSNASPGIVCVIAGVFLIFTGKPKIKVR